MSSEPGLEAALASGAGPAQLVPCDSERLVLVADTLRQHAAVLDEGGWSLSRVEVTSWRGPASAGFASVIEVEPARWRSASEAFLAGAAAVEGFVAAVTPARDLAARAAEVYRAYERKAAEAAALAAVGGVAVASVPERMAVGARIEALQRAQAVDPSGLVAEAEALRHKAISLLASARSAFEAAGDIAADALVRAAEGAPQARRFWESNIHPADIIGTGHTTLDWAGMVPGLGAASDAVNAGWYAVEGNWDQAAWSAIAMAPVAGDWLAAGRRAVKTVVAVDAIRTTERVAPRGPSSGPGWLTTHEVDGSHTLERHVDASRLYLVSRLYGPGRVRVASTFVGQSQAEDAVGAAIDLNAQRIQRFLNNPGKRTTQFDSVLFHTTGSGVDAGADTLRDMSGVRVFLIKDASADLGYRVWTAFPIP
ncbi:MAG: RNase A-like domain-containing protein [Lapillicoccus sp.]